MRIGLSCDKLEDHKLWEADICAYSSQVCNFPMDKLPFPMIGDHSRFVAMDLGMVDYDESDLLGVNVTCRAVFIVSPSDHLRLFLYYPATTGRNFDELLRVVDSLQLTENRGVATPANWKIGEKVMISAGATPEQASCLNSEYSTVTLPSGKNYIRFCQLPDHTKESEKQSGWKDPIDGKVTSSYDETVRIAQDISFAEYE
ncbi:peroxiredoxin-6-like [Convolutriloba macropyga]|uniref:peroxiredoxin-6-like n=1 Tax=Convolutriloba macropyga TaxID=536237 RepID=UPI003F51BFA8